jgi:uncharacterized protein YhbP (UPF0306 family)
VTLPPELGGELDPVRSLLDETTTLVLATRGTDGTPRATPVFFAVFESLKLVFLSDAESIHSRNLRRAPEVSVALYPEEPDWRRLRGLQMMGRAAALAGPEADVAQQAYARRFGFVAELSQALAASQIYAFAPTWIRLIDNRRRFGFQQEWTLG